MPFIRDAITEANPLGIVDVIGAQRVIDSRSNDASPFYLIEVDLGEEYEETLTDVCITEDGYIPSVGDSVKFMRTKSQFLTCELHQLKDAAKPVKKTIKKSSKISL